MLAAAVACAVTPGWGRAAPPKIGRVRWPGANGDIHGMIALASDLHGRQPAVLVLHQGDAHASGADAMADALALAGFVACVPAVALAPADASATLRWLIGNAYATGRVGIVAMEGAGAMVENLAAGMPGLVTCAVLFDASPAVPRIAAVPLLRLVPADRDDSPSYHRDWQETLSFLETYLLPDPRHRQASTKTRGPSIR